MKTREQLFIEAKSSNMKERKLAKLSLFMTAADLCDNCKKWDDSLPTVVCEKSNCAQVIRVQTQTL